MATISERHGRPSKGARTQFLARVPVPLADLVRVNAQAADMHVGSYVWAIVAEHYQQPWFAPAETRETTLKEILVERGVVSSVEQALSKEIAASGDWTAMVQMSLRIATPLAECLRADMDRYGYTPGAMLTEILSEWHGIELPYPSASTPTTPVRKERMSA